MSVIEEWKSDLRCDEGDKERYRNWGFTIYRTGYGPSTDQQWQRLLQTIQTHAHKTTLSVTQATVDDPGFQHIWSLFHLDARSDIALAGLDMDQLRLLYNNGDGGGPMNTDLRSHRVFLVADDEILSDVDAFTVKCVEVDYRTEDYIPRNPRFGGQRYFGWMPMKAGCVAGLWKHLEFRDLDRIAPPTIGGSHLVIWEDPTWL